MVLRYRKAVVDAEELLRERKEKEFMTFDEFRDRGKKILERLHPYMEEITLCEWEQVDKKLFREVLRTIDYISGTIYVQSCKDYRKNGYDAYSKGRAIKSRGASLPDRV